MRFVVEMLVDRQVKDNWGEQKSLDYTRLRYHLEICHGLDKRGLERLYITYEELRPIDPTTDEWYQRHLAQLEIKPDRKRVYINTELENNIAFIYLHPDGDIDASRKHRAFEIEQTVLSGINNTSLPHAFAVREEMRHWKFMQLNPVELRKPSAILAKEFMSSDGANLPTALARMKADDPFFIKDLSR